MTRKIAGGGDLKPAEFARAQAVHVYDAAALDRARESAKVWEKGVGGLLGIILATGTLSLGKDIRSLPTHWGVPIAGGLAFCVILAVVALSKFAAATGGRLKRVPTSKMDPDAIRRHTALRTVELIDDAVGFTYTALGAFIILIGVLWFAPRDEPVVVLDTPAGEVCGMPTSVEDRAVHLTANDGGQVVVSLDDIEQLKTARNCPAD